MIKTTTELNGKVIRLTVNGLEVSITTYPKKGYEEEFGEEEGINKVTKKYQIVVPITVGNVQILQCINTKTGVKDIYNVQQCKCILSLPISEQIELLYVCGELFVKTMDDEHEKIYDEIGNLIASDQENHITIKFSATEPVISKTNKKTGKTRNYNFEGCSC